MYKSGFSLLYYTLVNSLVQLPDVTLNMVSQYEDLLDFEDRHEGVAVIGLVTAVFEPFIYHTRSGYGSLQVLQCTFLTSFH